MHRGEDERRRAEIPPMSRVQILSCEHSYNIKARCSCCLPLVGSTLPGRFVHFWVLLQTRTHARTASRTLTHGRSDDLMSLWNVVVDPGPLDPTFMGCRQRRVLKIAALLSKSEGNNGWKRIVKNGFKSDYGNIVNTRRSAIAFPLTFITVLFQVLFGESGEMM